MAVFVVAFHDAPTAALERIRKEAVIACFSYWPNISAVVRIALPRLKLSASLTQVTDLHSGGDWFESRSRHQL
jgi:hypothetical protein